MSDQLRFRELVADEQSEHRVAVDELCQAAARSPEIGDGGQAAMLALGLVIGGCLGAALGAAMGSAAIGIPLSGGLGIAVGAGIAAVGARSAPR